jgi:DNA-binding transcriptional MerR regulator
MAEGFTIGEVLNQLKEGFADITISKIRFLESEGLIAPARTDSGYRKFTDDDVDRLRFILTAQRDHYLPLKVIREQLDRLDEGEMPPQMGPGAVTSREDDAAPQAPDLSRVVGAVMGEADGPKLGDSASATTLGLRELCEAAGLEPHEVRELRDYGVLGERGDDANHFDSEDLVAARAARELLQLGLEARHLRMYRQFCDRELALFEQLAAPLLRQRNPEARRQATGQLEKLAGLAGQLQQALLIRSLRAYLHGT